MAVIEVNNVYKNFKVYFDKGPNLKERVLYRHRSRFEERNVLNGINLIVEKGEAVGLVGENGCGKSTLLKLLTRIMYPNEGSILVDGRVSSLIELGAGFHPDMSGRENIYTNASIFGLTRKEINERVEDIIEFSELREYIDNPVRTYSSGMYMRLAFAVAINVDADVLLIDEILAVGDTNFQQKCYEHLRLLKENGVTIVIVTHDMDVVQKFCDLAIWIEDGVIRESGDPYDVVSRYMAFMNAIRAESMEKEQEKGKKFVVTDAQCGQEKDSLYSEDDIQKIDTNANRFGLGFVQIVHAVLKNAQGEIVKTVVQGEKLLIELEYQVHTPMPEYVFGIGFNAVDNTCVYGINTKLDGIRIPHKKNHGTVIVEIGNLPLLAGIYGLNVSVIDIDATPLDFVRNYFYFNVISDDRAIGFVSIVHKWKFN